MKSGIGDINSEAKGSGARFNSNKPPLNYIPIRQQLIVWHGYRRFSTNTKLIMTLTKLASFEERRCEMYDVIRTLDLQDMVAAAYVWDYGAKKYAPWNWAKGMAWSVPLGCIGRHMKAILEGEDIDPESQCSHWGHVVCNLLMLEHYENYYTEGDDRPPSFD